MKRIFFSFIMVCSLMFSVSSQNNEILVTIGDTKISKAEFERIYKKNNSNLYNESDKKSPAGYIDLFVNFKLKVMEAEALKMDTNSVFVNELAGYRKELAAPYLTDMKYNEKMVRELYDRMTKEVNASHILLRVEKNSNEEQVQAVRDRIMKIREEIIAGKDFAEAAAEYSEDPSAKLNGGNLNYFSAFQMVAPFENAAFTTPVGEISEPVRTGFGFHILKVHDIRKNRGEILVAHIMKMFPKGASDELKAKAKTEIDSIYQELLDGADFAELARTRSDDKNSAVQGGKMPWFSSGRILKEFSEPAFALKNIGDISEPIETPYGYHIIKKLDQRGVVPFEEAKADIEKRIKRDPKRNLTSKTAFIDKLKKEYNFSENKEGLEKLKGLRIENPVAAVDFDLFSIDGKTYPFSKLQKYIDKNKIVSGTYSAKYDKWVEDEITELEDSKLEEKYPDFRYLMQEYHDGILLFNISEEKIWNKAVEDSVGLEAFYKSKKNKYKWGERFKGCIVTCTDEKTREEADKFFAAEMTTGEITDKLNDGGKMITIEEGAWEKGSNPIVDYFIWNKTKPADLNEILTFVRGNKIPPETKKLSEARGLYIADFQDYLEKKWIKELRKKYKVKIDKKVLKTVKGV